MKKFFLLTILIGSIGIASAQKVNGIASNVYDGDTFKLTKSDGTVLSVRLANIDAPELAQTHGKSSRDFLKNRINQKNVVVDIKSKDRYARSVGVVFLNDENINRTLVANGHAWHYAQYSKDVVEMNKLENTAKMKKIGLWGDKNPTSPWKYREEKKAAQKPNAA